MAGQATQDFFNFYQIPWPKILILPVVLQANTALLAAFTKLLSDFLDLEIFTPNKYQRLNEFIIRFLNLFI
jgi:hypothetical protein